MQMSSGPKPFNSWPHGVGRGEGVVGGCGPPCPSLHQGGPGGPGAFPSRSTTPPHAALASHTNSPCVNVAFIITDCHSKRDPPPTPWAGPGMAPPQNQAAGTRVLALWDLGGRG